MESMAQTLEPGMQTFRPRRQKRTTSRPQHLTRESMVTFLSRAKGYGPVWLSTQTDHGLWKLWQKAQPRKQRKPRRVHSRMHTPAQ